MEINNNWVGSVRIPAHYCGIYTIKCSTGRFPRVGNVSAQPGQEGIKAVYSPMTQTLPALIHMMKSIIDMKPWTYDHTVDPIPWRECPSKKLKIGYYMDDGVIRSSPACARALETSVEAMKKAGHEVVVFTPPSPFEGLKIASNLLLADGGEVACRPMRIGENHEKGLGNMIRAFELPRFVKWAISCYYYYIRKDYQWAELFASWSKKSYAEQQDLVVARELYRSNYMDAWQAAGIDVLLTVPNSLPSVPHYALGDTFLSCGPTFLFNLLDYPAGVLPVLRVDKTKDKLDSGFKPKNHFERQTYKHYNAEKMHGLPVGVQVICPRLEEEQTLKAMEMLQQALKDIGVVYS